MILFGELDIITYFDFSEAVSANHSTAYCTLNSVCAPSRNHWQFWSLICWYHPDQKNSSMSWVWISFIWLCTLGAFTDSQAQTTARVREQFVLWTFNFRTVMFVRSIESTPINLSTTSFLAACCWRIIVITLFWKVKKARLSDLKISALCQAIFSIVRLGSLTWFIAIDVMTVTIGVLIIFIASNSSSKWVS